MFDPRAVLEMAVDDAAYAGDREVQYRPHESPANPYFNDLAGAAGGILASSPKTSQATSYPSPESIPAKAYSSAYSSAWCSARASWGVAMIEMPASPPLPAALPTR